MNRIDRLQAILIQIQSKKIVKAHEIAERFGISLRTVYRDMRALEEAGVPLGAEAGVGYFIDDSYSLPPVMFTSNEACALLMAGKLFLHLSDKKMDTDFQNALMKIKAVIRSDDKDLLERLEQSVKVYHGITQPPVHDSIFLQEIQHALACQKVLSIAYYSPQNRQTTSRSVEPIGLIFYAMNWHVIAFCRLRNEYRDFRLNRIQKLEVTDESFEKSLDLAFEEYLDREKQATPYIEIELLVTKELAQLIHESKYWYGLIDERQEERGIRMKFLNPDMYGFARWVLLLGNQADVLEPPELKELVQELVKTLCEKYRVF